MLQNYLTHFESCSAYAETRLIKLISAIMHESYLRSVITKIGTFNEFSGNN